MTEQGSTGAALRRRHAAPLPGLRRLYADLAVLATMGAVVGLFAISAITLEHFGIAYVTSGGGVLSKFHPSGALAIAAIGLRCLSNERPLPTAWRLLTGDAGVVLMLVAVVVAAAYAVVISRTPVTGLFDTFVLPTLCFLLLRDLDPTIRKWLALLVAAVLCVNAVMAIVELVEGVHFIQVSVPEGISADPLRGDTGFSWQAQLAQEWRPTALLGHPLVNGLIVGVLITCLVARGSRWLPWGVKGPFLLLQCAAMLSFGARTSLVLTVAFAAVLLLQSATDALGRGARLKPRDLAVGLGVVAIAVVGLGVLAQTGVFDRSVDRFFSDAGSADTRVTMFQLFDHFSWSDLLAPDKDVLATWQRVSGLEFGIESSWVGLVLTYGIVVTGLLVIGLAAFSRSVIRASGSGASLVLVSFFIAVSGSASLSGKTTVLATTVVLILLFLYPDDGQPARMPRLPRL